VADHTELGGEIARADRAEQSIELIASVTNGVGFDPLVAFRSRHSETACTLKRTQRIGNKRRGPATVAKAKLGAAKTPPGRLATSRLAGVGHMGDKCGDGLIAPEILCASRHSVVRSSLFGGELRQARLRLPVGAGFGA
jgi:hypothetical protein